MKTFFGIEQIRLKGKRVPGGYLVRGALPFVSNLGADHYFGAVFEVEDEPKHYVMADRPVRVARASRSPATPSSSRSTARAPSACSCATCSIPDALVLADPSDAYIKRIRAGFVLLQAGMAFGLIRGCIALMNQVKGPLGHVNKLSRRAARAPRRATHPHRSRRSNCSPPRRSRPTQPTGAR